MDLNATLRRAVELGASDIHLKIGQPPILRRDGSLGPMEAFAALDEADLTLVLNKVTEIALHKRDGFYDTGDLDIAYQDDDLPRFRVNAFRQRGAISFAFRVIPKNVPTFEQLSLPAGVKRLADEHRGLILVTGATGSGKTTTLAAMLDYMNRTRKQHIVTIEDPIEILHPDRSCIVNQREVGLDTTDFMQALRRALRQDPDVVLRGVISQRLLPRIGGGRVAAIEVMVTNTRIADLIRENESEGIPEAIGEGQFFDMQTFTHALIDQVLAGNVAADIAGNAATNRHDFLVALERALKQKEADERAAAAEAAAADGETPDGAAPATAPEPEPVEPMPTLRLAGPGG
jgi:Tfp pilus assembly pilus retraction ATPase PilT